MENSASSRLVEVRQFLKLSQKEMATELGIQPSYLSDVEKGKRKVALKIAYTLNSKYRISQKWLMDGIGEMQEKPTNLSIESYQIWQNIYQSDSRIKEIIHEAKSIELNIKDISDFMDRYYFVIVLSVDTNKSFPQKD